MSVNSKQGEVCNCVNSYDLHVKLLISVSHALLQKVQYIAFYNYTIIL